MSASKDKLNRRQLAESGLDKRAAAAKKEEQEARKSRIRYTVTAIVIVLVFAFIFIYNSALPSRMFTAVSINGQNYSVAQLNYYYSQAFSDYYNEHIIDILTGQSSLNTSESLADQVYTPADDEDASQYPEGYTWRDYFIDRAVERIEEVQLLTGLADADGFVLPEDDQTEYDEAIESLQDNWSGQSYSSLQQYINLNYGKGVTLDLIKTELMRTMLADAYAKSLRDGYEYTAAELDAAYDADANDTIRYAYYLVTDEDVDPDALAAAVNGTGEEEFTSYMEENYDGITPTVTSAQGENLSDAYSEWLLDPARKAGDAAVLLDEHEHEYEGEDGETEVEEDTDTYVVMFLDRDSNDYNRVSFRHILINTDNDEIYDSVSESYYADEEEDADEAEVADAEAEDADTEAETEEETFEDALLAATLTRAEEIYDEWKNGDATEDSFAALAEEYTDDSGSEENGGLYEEVTKGQMVAPIDEWIFDPARKPGDTTVVTYSGDNYSGSHVVYFVGAEDDTYAHILAREELSRKEYDEWLEAQTANDVVSLSHLRMVGKHR